MKTRLLMVPKITIINYGAVSHQTALAMVKGLKKITDSEILLSVTGVAGPSGGTLRTPVGCVFFGIGSKINKKYTFKTTKKIFHEKTRHAIQKKSKEYAMYLILKELKKI
jgi:PncC family amidohydrolase